MPGYSTGSTGGFNPRSPRGGATFWARAASLRRSFQSTLPTRGSDGRCSLYPPTRGGFQSTLPTRGSDAKPCAGRRCASAFQSTLPTRGSDVSMSRCPILSASFQSTLPTRGSDGGRGGWQRTRCICFNPRSPRGGATIDHCIMAAAYLGFNPRSPRGGATRRLCL